MFIFLELFILYLPGNSAGDFFWIVNHEPFKGETVTSN